MERKKSAFDEILTTSHKDPLILSDSISVLATSTVPNCNPLSVLTITFIPFFICKI